MAKWTAFPYDNAEYTYDAAALKKNWARLHAGDAEPLPKDDKALAQGLGGKVKAALETAIKLQPKHADAHIALGAFHAEVIDKVGSLLGRTQGASKDAGLAMYKQALKLNPNSAIAMVEYANGLVMLEGDKKMKEAEKLYAEAAACEPKDAMERLDVEMAKAELEE